MDSITFDDIFDDMRTTITIDDSLFESAASVAGEKNASSLVTKALKSLIATESKKRILRLSGKAPTFSIPERDARTPELSRVAESDKNYQSS